MHWYRSSVNSINLADKTQWDRMHPRFADRPQRYQPESYPRLVETAVGVRECKRVASENVKGTTTVADVAGTKVAEGDHRFSTQKANNWCQHTMTGTFMRHTTPVL